MIGRSRDGRFPSLFLYLSLFFSMENTAFSSSAHTTGPWHVDPFGTGDSGNLLVKQVRGAVICELDPLPEALANARLIAAAPDLLVCTQNLLQVCDDRLSILEEQGDPDEEVVRHYFLLRRDSMKALDKAIGL
ncbi:MAG: hypothetical protein ACKVP0_14530 [Pirellulaceae bacterium]